MPRVQRSIQAYARASKPTSDIAQSRKRKQILEDEQPEAVKKVKFELQTQPSLGTRTVEPAHLSPHVVLPCPEKCSKRKRAASPELETPFLALEEPGYVGDGEEELPEELDDLQCLQVAFLKSLSLYYAHNGAASPVDVQVLLPTITRLWGKRKATMDDVRLCLGVTYGGNTSLTTQLTLSHYGHGKYCVEIESRQRMRGVLVQAFDESELQSAFKKELRKNWKSWSGGEDELANFVLCLPRSAIVECSSYTKLKPTLAKGQQRLDEVLRSRPENQLTASKRQRIKKTTFEEEMQKPLVHSKSSITEVVAMRDQENTTPPPVTAPLAANFRALSLLDRIQKKQEVNSLALAHMPTKASIDRLAALQRAEEILQILELLATQKGPGLRASFPLSALVRAVQTSIRSPMSTEEVERCFAVLGKEVAPGYVEKKEFGTMKAVIVNRIFKPDASKVRQMVESAEAGTA